MAGCAGGRPGLELQPTNSLGRRASSLPLALAAQSRYVVRILADGERNWSSFLESATWFAGSEDRVQVGEVAPRGAWGPTCERFAELFPVLTALLSRAELTQVTKNGTPYRLYTWHESGPFPLAWIGPLASQREPPLFEAHSILLRSFGGIVERANEPESCWLLNQNESLTERESTHDAAFVELAGAFEGNPPPIPLDACYSISREANGNNTFCNRLTGGVVLFAQDHSFEHITCLPGCPKYTLYTFDGAADFVKWVETIARQWSNAIDEASR